METLTPRGGKHYIIGTNRADFPDGIKQSYNWCDIKVEYASQNQNQNQKQYQKHSQINLLGTNNALNEYLPGYSNITGIEYRVTLSKKAVNDYLERLTKFKKETSMITMVANFIKPYYRPESRDEIVFSTSGYLSSVQESAELKMSPEFRAKLKKYKKS